MPLIDEFRKIVEDYLEHSEFTSASPGHTNVVKSVIYSYEPNENDLRLAADAPLEPEGRGTLPGGESFGIGGGKKIVGNISNPLDIVDQFFPIAKMIPIVGAVLGAPAMIEILRKLMHAPGMPFDPRFKRDLQSEALQSVDRDQKAELRQGLVLVRITSSKTQRGEAGIGQTGQVGTTGIPRYDDNYEMFKKGILN